MLLTGAISYISKAVRILKASMTKKEFEIYSIGVYSMNMCDNGINLVPFPGVKNPVITAGDLKQLGSTFVADPFIVHENEMYYLFFEAMIKDKGRIALATSADGLSWKYQKIVLEEPFHLSYPHVFKWNSQYYLIPESFADSSIRLYQSVHFPYTWKFVKKIIEGDTFSDSTVFPHNNRWWLFTAPDNATLSLYYASNPAGAWTKHPMSPIVQRNSHIARPGGNILTIEGKLIRIAQDDYQSYGNALHAFEITKMTENEYMEKPFGKNPLLKASGSGWNKDGMHQLSTLPFSEKKNIAVVDGKALVRKRSITLKVPSLRMIISYLPFFHALYFLRKKTTFSLTGLFSKPEPRQKTGLIKPAQPL